MTARDLLFFILGATFAGGITYLYMSRESEIREENMVYETPKEEPEVRPEPPKKEPAQNEPTPFKDVDTSSATVPKEISSLDGYKAKEHLPKTDYFKIAGDYTAYEKNEEGLNKVEMEYLENMNRDPERIPPDVWKAGQDGPYEHVCLIYDPETNQLKEEISGDIVELPYLLIGNAIEDAVFQFSDEQFMYVRNFKSQTDYEIVKFNPLMVK